MPNIPVKNCCGCTACYSICSQRAIKMLPDAEGFLYPEVDAECCVDCGLCEQVCPVLHEPALPEKYKECVVAQHVDTGVLEACTSGGFIDALYYHVLENKQGYAAGVVFDSQFMPVHTIADSYEKAKAFRNSKYAQSNLNEIFQNTYELLKQGNLVMFAGTPCQVAGLKSFLRKEYDNLITADLVCRSIPSQKLWESYLNWQEKKNNAKIKDVACRRKTYGYHSGALEIQFSRGKKYCGSNRVDYYMKSFHHDICSRPSCYQCTFKTKHRCSDFTVFDCWNPELVSLQPVVDDNRGFSNVLVYTEKGKNILRELGNIKLYQADPEKMFLYTGGMESNSVKYPEERKSFYKDLDCLGFEKTVKKYVSVTTVDRLIESIKPLVYQLKQKFRDNQEGANGRAN